MRGLLSALFLFTLPAHALFHENPGFGPIPPPGGPTGVYDDDTPWIKAGVNYEQFTPDVTNPAHTVKPGIHVRHKFIGDTAYIDGEIDRILLDFLKERHREEPIARVVLNSFGGHAEASWELAVWIRENGLTTIVPANGTCASACTMVFQGGVERKAARYSVFLYHGVRAGPVVMQTLYLDRLKREGQESADQLWQEWTVDAQEKTRLLFDRYEALDARPALRNAYMSLPEDPDHFNQGNPLKIVDWRMNGVEAATLGVATELY